VPFSRQDLCCIKVEAASPPRKFHWHILVLHNTDIRNYEGWNFNSGNYLFTTDTK